MLTRKRCDADVQIIFISDEPRDVRHLARSLDQSNYRIVFASHSSSPTSMKGIWRSTLFERPFLPTAIIIDYFCEGGRLVDILRNVRRIVDRPGIELIIANAPEGADVRTELLALGADKVIQAEVETEAFRVAQPA